MAGAAAGAWLRGVLGVEARLLRRAAGCRRAAAGRHWADIAPLLVISSASLAALSQSAGFAIPMDRFRPNIVLDGADAHAEDSWSEIRHGPVTLKRLGPCGRCSIVEVAQSVGRRDSMSVYGALVAYRGEAVFGQYYAPVLSGERTLEVGAQLEAGHQRLQAWLRSECSAARSISCAKLGLPEDADPAAIREAYLRLVRTVHPDSPLRLSEGYDEFSALHEAYRHLTKDQGQGNQSNPRHQERLMLQWDSQEPGFESEAQMFKSRLLTVVGEFGDKGLPLSSLRKKYAQVWSGAALPAPTSFGLRKGCGLLEMLRHVAGDVLRVEMHARGQDPVLHADSTESKAVSWVCLR
ncbi:unnamed protein product [Effrenium voratum]|nr:unnamed protein product [Effrenium voratum]